MTDELYNKIDKFCNETDWSKYPTYEHALEDFIKGIVAEETKELEKENAELKADNDARKFAMAMSEQVEKQLREENAKLKETVIKMNNVITKTFSNLTKAKELLKDITSSYGSTEVSESQLYLKIKKAEQFISEVEK